jgi:hypothetical protein
MKKFLVLAILALSALSFAADEKAAAPAEGDAATTMPKEENAAAK